MAVPHEGPGRALSPGAGAPGAGAGEGRACPLGLEAHCCCDRAAPAEAAGMHCITLRLLPSTLEARFWRDTGTPPYAALDRSSQLISLLNLLLSQPLLIVLFPGSADHALINAMYAALVTTAAATRALLALAPERYRARRHALVAAQRAARGLGVAFVYWRASAQGWRSLLSTRLIVPPSLLHLLVVNAVYQAMQTLALPLPFTAAAPLAGAVSALTGAAVLGIVCVVCADAALMEAARAACMVLLHGKQLLSVALGPAAVVPFRGEACGACAPEVLICFFHALPCFISLYALHCRERRLKAQFLLVAGLYPGPPPKPVLPSAAQHLLAGLLILQASAAIAEAAGAAAASAAAAGRLPVACRA